MGVDPFQFLGDVFGLEKEVIVKWISFIPLTFSLLLTLSLGVLLCRESGVTRSVNLLSYVYCCGWR